MLAGHARRWAMMAITVASVGGGWFQSIVSPIEPRKLHSMLPAPRYTFSVAEYHRMIDAGIFEPDAQVELLGGELIAMSPMGHRHVTIVTRLLKQFVLALADHPTWQVMSQSPIVLPPRDEPEPDVCICAHLDRKPGPGEVRLVVEVADSSLRVDRDYKVPLYARHGIPEVWLWDLNANRLDVYQHPQSDSYRDIRLVSPGDELRIPIAEQPLTWDDLS